MSELTQAELENWIQTKATGKFYYKEVLDGQVNPKFILNSGYARRCKDRAIAIPVDGRDGWWRPVDKNLEEICWWEKDGEIGENIVLPLGLNKYCYIPRPSLIVIAGKYNVGKTALCINVVNRNLEIWEDKLDFYVSEGAEMMARKFKASILISLHLHPLRCIAGQKTLPMLLTLII